MRSPSATQESDAIQLASGSSANVQLEANTLLANCANAHKGKWDLQLLLEQAGDAELVKQADAVLQQTAPEMVAAGKQLLEGMEEPLLTLSLALCASKRGSGGRAPALDPQRDPRFNRKEATRILNKRRTAAVSKFKQKVSVLAGAAVAAGFMPNADGVFEHPGSITAAAGGAGGSSGAPTEPSPAAAQQRSAAAAAFWERGPGMFLKSAAERSKRPQILQQQPRQQRPQRFVKRMRSQQLLGSTASQAVSNVSLGGGLGKARARSASPVRNPYSVNDLEEGDQQEQQMSRPPSRRVQRCFSARTQAAASTSSFSASGSGQMTPWQEDACGGSVGPTDVYSSLAPAADTQRLQQRGSTAAAGSSASEWLDELMLDAVDEQLQEVADGWLFSDIGLPDSPSLGDLLRDCAPEGELPAQQLLPDSILPQQQQPQQTAPPAQHSSDQLPELDSPILADLLMTGSLEELPEPWAQQLSDNVQHTRAQRPAAATGAEAHAAPAPQAGAEAAGVYGAGMVFTPACSEAAAAPMQAGDAGCMLAPMLPGEAGMQSPQPVLPLPTGARTSPSSGHSSGSMPRLDGLLPMQKSPPGQHTAADAQDREVQQQQQEVQRGQWSWRPAAALAPGNACLQAAGSQPDAASTGRGAAGMVQGAGLTPAASAAGRLPLGVQGQHTAAALASPGLAYAGTAPFMAAGSSHSSCSNMPALLPAAAAAAGNDELEGMLMSVLARAGQQAALPAPPCRRPVQRHASTGDLLLGASGRADADRLLLLHQQQQQYYQPLPEELQPLGGTPPAPAGERLQSQASAPAYGFKPALSEGCLVTQLSVRPPRAHSMVPEAPAGSSWATASPGYPQTAGAALGSMSSSSGSGSSMGGGHREQRMARDQVGLYSLRRASAPAAAARPGARSSPFETMQAQSLSPLLLQEEPDVHVSRETAALIHFVADMLRSTDSRIAEVVRQQIVPTVSAAAVQGVEVRPVLRRLSLTLVDAHLQAQRAHLQAVLEAASEASLLNLATKASDLAAALRAVAELRELVTGSAAAGPSQPAQQPYSTEMAPQASTQTIAGMGGLRLMGSSSSSSMGYEGSHGRSVTGFLASVPGSQQWADQLQQSSVRGAVPTESVDWLDDRVVRVVMHE